MRPTSIFVLSLAVALAAPSLRAHAQDGTPAPAKKAGDVDKLVADLGADDCNKRDDAQKKLEAMGAKALPALEKAEKESQDAEVRARAHEAILTIKKGRSAPEGEKDQERDGPPLPPERRLAPGIPGPQGQDDDWNEIFKMFQGQQNPMMRDLPKILEKIQKQMQGLDEEFDKELKRPRDNGRGEFKVFQFQTRSKTPTERKLGVTLEPPAPALRAQLELSPTDGGLVVQELSPSRGAWKAGLKQYDVVLSIDGNPVRGPEDLRGLGDKDSKVEIIRKAKKETLVVRAATTPEPEKAPDEQKPEPQIRKF